MSSLPHHMSLAMALVPHWDDIRVKHTWNDVPSNWDSLVHLLPTPPLTSTSRSNLNMKMHRSMPSMIYGTHSSKEQVAQLVVPHRDTMDLVNSWLKFHGILRSSISVSHGGSWLTVAAVPVFQANEMLAASYQLYRESGTNDTSILRTGTHSLLCYRITDFASPRRHSISTTADMASRGQGSSSLHPGLVTPPDPRSPSTAGRGIPDTSAQAHNIVCMLSKNPDISEDTSNSTPSPLGFLNSLLYGNICQAMNDITSGSNPGCNTLGFSAIPGWDPELAEVVLGWVTRTTISERLNNSDLAALFTYYIHLTSRFETPGIRRVISGEPLYPCDTHLQNKTIQTLKFPRRGTYSLRSGGKPRRRRRMDVRHTTSGRLRLGVTTRSHSHPLVVETYKLISEEREREERKENLNVAVEVVIVRQFLVSLFGR
ncbi:hypothetical protein EI94DRAFT_1706767 [Lactarius quietus]|nr:hypothetical protein EI94DRAFT_1706767 [Lactarius quietus]